METKNMNLEEVEARFAAIKEEMNAPEADIDALNAEVDALEARKAEIKAEIEERNAQAAAIAEGQGEVVQNFDTMEERKQWILRN